jgi:hypothetical protein
LAKIFYNIFLENAESSRGKAKRRTALLAPVALPIWATKFLLYSSLLWGAHGGDAPTFQIFFRKTHGQKWLFFDSLWAASNGTRIWGF